MKVTLVKNGKEHVYHNVKEIMVYPTEMSASWSVDIEYKDGDFDFVNIYEYSVKIEEEEG